MNGFMTLLWLEYRRSRVWAIALIGSLAFWAWGLAQVHLPDAGQQLGSSAVVLSVAVAVGMLILCLMIGRIRAETRQGQYQILLLSPPSGYVHVLARFTFAAGVGIIYFIVIGALAWWTTSLSGLHLDTGSILQLLLVCPFYSIGTVLIPLLAWTLLLMVFVSAYRISGSGWIPGTVMILGTPFLFSSYFKWLAEIAGVIPGWHLFEGARALIENTSSGMIFETADTLVVLPQEPLWGMLVLSAIMLILAGRIWQEVEG